MTNPRRVLVVEDNDAFRRVLRSALEKHGHTVEEAEDGLEGVQKAVAWRPDIAVVDMEAPILDGYALARRGVRGEEKMLSGPARLQAVQQARERLGEASARILRGVKRRGGSAPMPGNAGPR